VPSSASARAKALAGSLRGHLIEACVRGDADRDWSALTAIAAHRAGLSDKPRDN